jgi:hypothetical protein
MLLHPLDFLGAEDEPEMRFFPGMSLAREEKLMFIDEVISAIAAHHAICPLREHAKHVRQQLRLPAVRHTQKQVVGHNDRLASDLLPR